MMRNNNKLVQLLHDYLSGKSTIEEDLKIDKWYNSINESRELAEDEDLSEAKERIYSGIQKVIENETEVVPFYKKTFVRAAAAILVIAMTSYFFMDRKEHKTNDSNIAKNKVSSFPNSNVLPPSANKTTITLANGKVVPLDSITNLSQGNASLVQQNGKLVYNAQNATNNTVVTYNTITVPKGGKPAHLILSDGSNVWLNVASAITYPTAFIGNKRKIQMSGEAYFEIAKDKTKPFITDVDGTQIEVLGTHFNVMAYNDEGFQNTTLLEGSIKITNAKSSKILSPGFQAKISNQTNGINISEADIEKTMGWKIGAFVFKGDNVQQIMRQVARWYDVEVIYDNNINDKRFSGIVNRSNDITQVLNILETGGIKFKIIGRKIYISA